MDDESGDDERDGLTMDAEVNRDKTFADKSVALKEC